MELPVDYENVGVVLNEKQHKDTSTISGKRIGYVATAGQGALRALIVADGKVGNVGRKRSRSDVTCS